MELFSTKPPRSRLLDLPAELREHIFSIAVTSEKPIVTFRLDKFQKESYAQAFQPSITKVSRQVRREALPLYYDRNEFIIHTEGQKAEDAHRWLHYSQPHLPKLCRLALWMRYVTLTNDHSPSSGAIGVYLRHDPRVNWGCGRHLAMDHCCPKTSRCRVGWIAVNSISYAISECEISVRVDR
jgi:hypothetical protein